MNCEGKTGKGRPRTILIEKRSLRRRGTIWTRRDWPVTEGSGENMKGGYKRNVRTEYQRSKISRVCVCINPANIFIVNDTIHFQCQLHDRTVISAIIMAVSYCAVDEGGKRKSGVIHSTVSAGRISWLTYRKPIR